MLAKPTLPVEMHMFLLHQGFDLDTVKSVGLRKSGEKERFVFCHRRWWSTLNVLSFCVRRWRALERWNVKQTYAEMNRNDEPFGFKHLYAHKTPHFNLTFGVDFVCFDQPVLLTIKQAEIWNHHVIGTAVLIWAASTPVRWNTRHSQMHTVYVTSTHFFLELFNRCSFKTNCFPTKKRQVYHLWGNKKADWSWKFKPATLPNTTPHTWNKIFKGFLTIFPSYSFKAGYFLALGGGVALKLPRIEVTPFLQLPSLGQLPWETPFFGAYPMPPPHLGLSIGNHQKTVMNFSESLILDN